MTENKSIKLNSILEELDTVAVAFSGGVDSSFLLHRAFALKKSNVIAITVKTPYIPTREINEAKEFTARYGIRHEILEVDFPSIIESNPIDRCYLCKKTLFTQVKAFAEKNNFRYVIDGTNSDDTGEYRPGMKALKEMVIISPLLESGLTKNDIRELSKLAGLDLWDKPAMACLLTRIPYNTAVEESKLRMIEKAEEVLFEKGYPGTRVRVHGEVARIECLPGYIEKIIYKPVREEIIFSLKKIGFRYVSLDLEGYRTGSSDPVRKE